MSKEILLVVESVSNEKGVPQEVIFEALELALATATKKRYADEVELRVAIDRESGEYDTFRRWRVLADDEESEMAEAELTLQEVADRNLNLAVGEFYEEPVESIEYGRIAAQTAKQVVVQKVREAERAQVVDAYDRVGELVNGQVKKVTRDAVIVDLAITQRRSFPVRTGFLAKLSGWAIGFVRCCLRSVLSYEVLNCY